jgi:site-specific DNA-methyltransferase (adenine-specific)
VRQTNGQRRPALFEEFSWVYGGFDLDPCATQANAKCRRYFTRKENGLAQEWRGKVFINPPYCKFGHVHFIRGCLKFGRATNSAPFPSAIVTFGKFFSL